MDKSTKLLLKNNIKNLKDNKNVLDNSLAQIELLMTSQRNLIKQYQDKGMSDEIIENEIDAVNEIQEAYSKISISINDLVDAISYLEAIKSK